MSKYPIPMIISGGQTGVDRAALDFALKNDIACGGWCPLTRKAHDGTISERYPLIETSSISYRQRTGYNIRDSNATLVICRSSYISDGTSLTIRLAKAKNRPLFVCHYDLSKHSELIKWLHSYKPIILNVAGPRESECVGIYTIALQILDHTLCKSNILPPNPFLKKAQQSLPEH